MCGNPYGPGNPGPLWQGGPEGFNTPGYDPMVFVTYYNESPPISPLQVAAMTNGAYNQISTTTDTAGNSVTTFSDSVGHPMLTITTNSSGQVTGYSYDSYDAAGNPTEYVVVEAPLTNASATSVAAMPGFTPARFVINNLGLNGYGTAPVAPIAVERSKLNIDSKWLSNNEGGQRKDGYTLPPNQFPHSGVTVGTGVDLAQHTASELQSWGLDQATIDQLQPYLATGPGQQGPEGQAAVDALSANGGLTLTQAQADALDSGAFTSIAMQVAANYNAANPGVNDFTSLPSAVQTVLVDIAYKYGPAGAPSFMSDADYGNWANAVAELQNFGDTANGAAGRLANDAALLQGAITSGGIMPYPSDLSLPFNPVHISAPTYAL